MRSLSRRTRAGLRPEYLQSDIPWRIFHLEYDRIRAGSFPPGALDPSATGRAADASLRARLDDARSPPRRVHSAQLRIALSHRRGARAEWLDCAYRARERRTAARADDLPARQVRS